MRLAVIAMFTVAAIAVASLGFVVEVPSPTPYSPFNTDRTGFSTITESVGAVPLISLHGFNGTLIVPLTHWLDNSEMRLLTSFIVNGGRLIIIDENGFSNSFINDYLNLSLTIVPVPVYDYVLNYNGSASLLFINATIGKTPLKCYFYKPASISMSGHSSIVLGSTSALSFRDIDGDGFFSLGDQFGPFPVVIRAEIGKGTIYIITDLDAFTNSFINLGNNSALIESLVGDGDVGIYMGGLNASFIDYIKIYTRIGGGWISGLAELSSLIVVAVVVFYGRRFGAFA